MYEQPKHPGSDFIETSLRDEHGHDSWLKHAVEFEYSVLGHTSGLILRNSHRSPFRADHLSAGSFAHGR